MRRQRLPYAWVIAIGVAAAALATAAHLSRAFDHIETRTIDGRFAAVGGPSTGTSDIVIVGIDRHTQDELGRAPLRRSYHGRLVDLLRRQKAKVIAYDLQFTEPTADSEDQALIDAVARAQPVVLATAEVGPHGESGVFGGDKLVREIGAQVGYSGLPIDSDGVSRRLKRTVSGMKAFSVVVAEAATGRSVNPDAFGDRGAWVDFQGPPGSFRTLSFADVLDGRVDVASLKGKIVVVGSTDPVLGDVHPAPGVGNKSLSGPEVQANAIATVLAGFPLQSPPRSLAVLLIAAFAFVAPVAARWLSPARVLAVAALALIVGLFIPAAAFRAGEVLPVTYSIGALVLGTAGALAARYLSEARERRRTRTAFSRFVPEGVMDDAIQRQAGDLRTGGAEVIATVMFSDLRGFTAFSEALPPRQVIAVLNRYLAEMSDAIGKYGGTVIDYMGDGIMAVFGAPVAAEDHADRALRAAVEMVSERLSRFNTWLRSEGFDEGFRMGIGLCSGPVIAGNIGSETRVGFTAIGDTTNTAARLEAMTRSSPFQLFLAESTRSLLKDPPQELNFVGELPVRGRQAPIRVWSFASEETAAPR